MENKAELIVDVFVIIINIHSRCSSITFAHFAVYTSLLSLLLLAIDKIASKI